MIKKWNEFIREFVENNENSLIDAKMEELRDLINGVTDGQNIIYEWENKNDHQLSINFSANGLDIKYEFDIDDLHVTKVAGETIDFQTDVESIDEGLEIIERDIYSILGISEARKGRPKAQRYKGRKIPGKYLTKNPGAMKKEIDTFRGKKEYKKDWDADYTGGKGGVGKRVKTKKSAATKAYQRMFGSKNENYNEWFSLTDKYDELPDDVLFPRTEIFDEWLKSTPNHIKLLSMICGMIDGNIAENFQLDDTFFSALENEYPYAGFELTKDEVIESCYKLREEGYLN